MVHNNLLLNRNVTIYQSRKQNKQTTLFNNFLGKKLSHIYLFEHVWQSFKWK